MRIYTLFLYLIIAVLPTISLSETIKQDHVEVRLITGTSENVKTLNIGVHFKIDPEWHIYWKNPGDSGAAPKFQLTGAKLENVQWPYPSRLPVGPLTNFGYSKEVVFILETTAAEEKMKLNLEWLVCKVECIPGFGEFSFTKDSLDVDQKLFSKFQELVPKESTDWQTKFTKKDESTFTFALSKAEKAQGLSMGEIKNVFVYPENGDNFKTEAAKVEPSKDSLQVSVALSPNARFTKTQENFTFVIEESSGAISSFTKQIEIGKPQSSWIMGLLLAFLGGLILNVMPCVFPILFLKAFGFLKETEKAKIRQEGWGYFAGVIVSFFLIGALLSLLRFSGEAVGWGYQMQNPYVVYLLAFLFFAMALNFYGYFEMGDSIAGKAGSLGRNRFFSGSFGTGVLAVLVASPCTAPFMGSALGLTLLLPPYQSLLIFVSLGVGMALPMLLLSYAPWLIQKLPRSGQWMITVKQLLSFPLFATCVWLLWVLVSQKGIDTIFISLISFLTFTMGIWILNLNPKIFLRSLAWLLIVASPALAIMSFQRIEKASTSTVSAWAAYDELVIQQRRETQAVFIDFTATWCITCQVNKRTVLDTDEIQKIFKDKNIFLVRADWTNHDPVITQALARHNRNSVPFYIYYSKIKGTQVLPELLTKEMIKNLVKGEN